MAYAACISYVDAQIGKICQTMDEEKLWDNTVVCLWGDHGFHLGDKGIFGKHTNYEQATRSPLIIAAPGLRGGLRVKQATEHVDIFPTVCELAGLTTPSSTRDSLVLMMRGKMEGKGSAMKSVPEISTRATNHEFIMGYAIRNHRYRYVGQSTSTRDNKKKTSTTGSEIKLIELYDYDRDPHEEAQLSRSPRIPVRHSANARRG